MLYVFMYAKLCEILWHVDVMLVMSGVMVSWE